MSTLVTNEAPDFTFVCPSEIIAFDEELDRFKAKNAEVIGVSADSHFTHLAWKNTPRDQGGIGEINYPLVADLDLSRSVEEAIGMLDALRFSEEHGDVCPANWHEGDEAKKSTAAGVAKYLAKHTS